MLCERHSRGTRIRSNSIGHQGSSPPCKHWTSFWIEWILIGNLTSDYTIWSQYGFKHYERCSRDRESAWMLCRYHRSWTRSWINRIASYGTSNPVRWTSRTITRRSSCRWMSSTSLSTTLWITMICRCSDPWNPVHQSTSVRRPSRSRRRVMKIMNKSKVLPLHPIYMLSPLHYFIYHNPPL